jgi:hypothetical protein
MKRNAIVLGAILATAGAGVMLAQGGFKNIKEALTGYEEVNPISTTGNGTFDARISNDGSQIDYTLTYSDLEGDVTMSHIHFGLKSTNGPISVWLCQTAAMPAPAPVTDITPQCATPGGTVTGTLTAANVIGPAAQGIEPGQFSEVVAAIRAGATYVNVHSSKWGGGEIRSQLTHEGH